MNEDAYVASALRLPRRQGGGEYTKSSQRRLSELVDGKPVLLTQSCTAALEFSALLLGIGDGDEVILPSYTFPSTATAFAVRGARLVFVDVDVETQNIDPNWAEAAITSRTRAIVSMHYGGIACDMLRLEALASKFGVALIEDAAQAIGARSADGRALGSIGAIGALSFHDTKNISSGEGGAVILGDEKLLDRAEVMWEKGTDRSKFLRGQIDKYTWVDLGSSFLPSEVTAALLNAQLEDTQTINAARLATWARYHDAFAEFELSGAIARPVVPQGAVHNAHLYYLMLPSAARRDTFMTHMREQGVETTFHYVPLHDSKAGRTYGRIASPMTNSIRAGECLVRLPLWAGLSTGDVDRVINAARDYLGSAA